MATASVIDAPPDVRPGRIGRLRQHLAGLFPDAPARPVSQRGLLLGTLAVVAGTAISLARTTGTGPFQTIWEEDARDLLTDALAHPGAFNLVKPYVGYFQLLPRMLAEVATFFPISWAAAVLSIEAAVVTALLTLLVYVTSGVHLRHPLARALVAAPMLFSPTAENVLSEIYNRPATVQFFLVYAVFWLMLWAPTGRTGRAVLIGVVGLSAFSTFLVVLFIPLAALRLYVRRDRTSATLLGLLGAGAALQLAGLALHLTNRAFVVPRYDPFWALWSYVVWAVPHSVLGYRLARSLGDVLFARNLALIVLAWAVIAAVVVVAVRRLTRPQWLLAAVAGVHSVALACMTIMSNGVITQRYLLPVELLLFSAMVALLLPADRLRPAVARTPLIAFAVLVVVVGAVNYRWTDTYRAHSPRWTEQVHKAAVACQAPGRREVSVRSGPVPFYSLVTVPCHDLNRHLWCQDPFCTQIGALDAPGQAPRRGTR